MAASSISPEHLRRRQLRRHVQKYAPDGKLLLQIGQRGKFNSVDGTRRGAGQRRRRTSPHAGRVVVDPGNGDIYVSDGYGNRRMVVFDKAGKFLRQWGRQATDEETQKAVPGVFAQVVHCIAMSNEGLIYACDRQGNRVQVFRKDGSFVRNIPIPNTSGKLPDKRGTAWWVAFSPDREQKFMYVMNGGTEQVHTLDHASGKILSSFGRPGHQIGNFTHGHTIAVDSRAASTWRRPTGAGASRSSRLSSRCKSRRRSMLRHAVRVLGLAALTMLVASPAASQTRAKILETGVERPASAIFIGNSFFYYNNSLHNHVRLLLHAADPQVRFRSTSVTISGSGSDWHDVQILFPTERARFLQLRRQQQHRVQQERTAVRSRDHDGLQPVPIHPQLKTVFREYARKHSDTVRKHGAKPVWFMSWAYADKPAMTEELAEAYTQAGNDNNAFVIPAGLAFARALKQRPDLVLYAADKRHPSVAGTYLAATTLYAALFRKSPAGLSYTSGLDVPTAALLRRQLGRRCRNISAPGRPVRNSRSLNVGLDEPGDGVHRLGFDAEKAMLRLRFTRVRYRSRAAVEQCDLRLGGLLSRSLSLEASAAGVKRQPSLRWDTISTGTAICDKAMLATPSRWLRAIFQSGSARVIVD